MNTQGWRLGTSTGFRITGLRVAGFSVLAAWFIACAGDDTPPVDNQTRSDLAEQYPDDEGQEATAGSANAGGGAAGAAGNGGSGGRASGGSGGRASAGASSGGSGSPTGGGSSSADVCDAFTTILQPRCGSVGCHGPGSGTGAFGVAEENATDFVGKTGTYASNGCDYSYIDSADPSQSLIYLKLDQNFPTDCGNLQMPANGAFLTEDEKACILSWLGQF